MIGGLAPAQASVLSVISARGPLSVSALTQFEGLNPTMVSRIVGKLDRAGFIRRVPNPDDLRSVNLEITEAGDTLQARIRSERDRILQDCVDRMSASDLAKVQDVLPLLEQLAAELDGVVLKSRP
ncbi:MAG TPA: MarR family transcriptional regulator [Microbacteriaceae bacterium]|nr:MarR family transcriptional regulator [Microbacteriaceae bacterium]